MGSYVVTFILVLGKGKNNVNVIGGGGFFGCFFFYYFFL